eukprot:gnl/MRDRNA2_/MRDRNA2_205467_c0_seq1.p1 gnl/MRDRNA2_/MRDRNA2_205467_c0~~gnl/MRDRNA2_/MRDRNA2_205467_c0_seq1.p1  ORF type:complete len:266 (+),score=50.38 gnl/MRDRNA2_/MRDRNA2_205467_c0_seq1:233-1030(+)
MFVDNFIPTTTKECCPAKYSGAQKVAAVNELVKTTSIETTSMANAKAAMTDIVSLGKVLGLTKLSIIGNVGLATCHGFSSDECDAALTRLAAKRALLLTDLGVSAASDAGVLGCTGSDADDADVLACLQAVMQVMQVLQALKDQMQKCINAGSKSEQQAIGCSEVSSLTSGKIGADIEMQATVSPASAQQTYIDCISRITTSSTTTTTTRHCTKHDLDETTLCPVLVEDCDRCASKENAPPYGCKWDYALGRCCQVRHDKACLPL